MTKPTPAQKRVQFLRKQLSFRRGLPDRRNTYSKRLLTRDKLKLERRAQKLGYPLDRRRTLRNMYAELYWRAGNGPEPAFVRDPLGPKWSQQTPRQRKRFGPARQANQAARNKPNAAEIANNSTYMRTRTVADLPAWLRALKGI